MRMTVFSRLLFSTLKTQPETWSGIVYPQIISTLRSQERLIHLDILEEELQVLYLL